MRRVKVTLVFKDHNKLPWLDIKGGPTYLQNFKHDLINILMAFDEVEIEKVECEEIK